MLDTKQRHILEAVVQVLAVAGIQPWFEARLIKDSSKKLNGKRISSKTKTDLASVLKVADERRVNMLPNYRMELRMYATVGKSRSVFMGQETVVGIDPGAPDGDSTVVMVRQGDRLIAMTPDLLPPKVAPTDEKIALTPKGEPVRKKLPVLGVLNVDNPADPRHREWGTGPRILTTGEPIEAYLQGRANYSPAKNVERLREEGLTDGDPLLEQAKAKVSGGHVVIDRSPMGDHHYIPEHACDANGPMRQRESDGPFLTTCSLCGDFHAGST